MRKFLESKNLLKPALMLMLMTVAMRISMDAWMALINNFSIEKAAFSGKEIGILQSVREIPGFLAFLAIYFIIFVKEQRLAIISLLFLGFGVAITGFFEFPMGLYLVTLLMSIGFHYYETVFQSLSLQWLGKSEAPKVLGKVIAVGSFSAIIVYSAIWFLSKILELDMKYIFIIMGGVTILISLFVSLVYPMFEQKVEQNKHFVLRKQYWLYYALTFMGGARRQIFVVFAGFLMVEKFGFSVSTISALFLVNCVINMYFAPKIGGLIVKLGEKKILILEYVGLFIIFTSYAFVQSPYVAIFLYIADHAFFAMAIAIKTYFQKIAKPEDIAPTAAVSFSINHIAAVAIPAMFGVIWVYSNAIVFLIGAAMSIISLILSFLIPLNPEEGNENISFSQGLLEIMGNRAKSKL